MKKFLQKKLNNEKGMTLIELLAVIVIIAIIAAIAIPAIGNIIENSRHGAVKSDYQNAIAAANLYFTDNPDKSTVTVDVLMGIGAPASGGTTATKLSTSYLDDRGSLLDVTVNKVSGGNTIEGTAKANDTNYDIDPAVTNNTLSNTSNADFGAEHVVTAP